MNVKDKSVFRVLGASNHTEGEREELDFYASQPTTPAALGAMDLLLQYESFTPVVWEPTVGQGHLAEPLKKAGYKVIGSDIVDRGYPDTHILNFLLAEKRRSCDIVANPPYGGGLALAFAQHALALVRDGGKVAMLVRLLFLESQSRQKFFQETCPKVYIPGARLSCAKNGEFQYTDSGRLRGGAQAHVWMVWTKGYTGPSVNQWV